MMSSPHVMHVVVSSGGCGGLGGGLRCEFVCCMGSIGRGLGGPPPLNLNSMCGGVCGGERSCIRRLLVPLCLA